MECNKYASQNQHPVERKYNRQSDFDTSAVDGPGIRVDGNEGDENGTEEYLYDKPILERSLFEQIVTEHIVGENDGQRRYVKARNIEIVVLVEVSVTIVLDDESAGGGRAIKLCMAPIKGGADGPVEAGDRHSHEWSGFWYI